MADKDIRAGRAYVELTIRDKLAAGFRRAATRLKAFADMVQTMGAGLTGVGSSIAAASGAILGPLTAAAKSFADTGSALADMSARTGVATDQLSELVYAAEQTGASAGDLEVALKTMAKNGIDPRTFDQQAAAIAAITDPTLRAQAALEMFGKSGLRILPMAAELAQLRSEARGLGLTVNPQDAAAADKLGDAFDRMRKVVGDLMFELGAAIAEPLTRALDAITKVVAATASWVSQNRGLVVLVATIASVVGIAGGAILSFGLTVVALGAAISGVSAAITFLASPIGIAVAAVSALIAVVVGLTAAWIAFSESGRQAANNFGVFIGGMVDAIAKGDLLNAWGQLATGMTIVWETMAAQVKAIFWEIAKFITGIISGMLRDLSFAIGEIEGLLGHSLGGNAIGNAARGIDAAVNAMAQGSANRSAAVIAGLQAQLDALRAMAAKPVVDAAENAAKEAAAATGGAAGRRGGSAGTFNAAASSLLGRAGGPMDRSAKAAEKSATLLEKIKATLEDIEDNTADDEGFAFS